MKIIPFICFVTGCSLSIGAVWLFLGARVSRIFDWFIAGRATRHAIDPMTIAFDPAGISSRFSIGSWSWPLSWPRSPEPFELTMSLDEQQRLVLAADGTSFTFGPVQQMWSDQMGPRYQFVPDADDVVSFSRNVSRLPWPTPFTFNVMGGAVPKWKRHSYDRLRWTKRSGATMEIIWTDEFWFYRGSDWSDTCNNRLAKVRIRQGDESRQQR